MIDDHLHVNHVVRMVYEIVLSLSLLPTLSVDLEWVAQFSFLLITRSSDDLCFGWCHYASSCRMGFGYYFTLA